MSWPTMSDYQEAIQNPGLCFSDAQLRAGTAAINALGLPTPVTGGFCSVYQVASGKTRWAVRCFLHNITDLRDRYSKISKFLRWRKLREMVGFEYVPEGIRIRGEWHPVLKMEWVDGDTLNVWVDKNVKNGRALRRLDDRWAELIDGMEKAQIGHCDLQHGNILIDDSGHIRLIDYDGMYVPPLRGRGSHEKGHPAYQHPQREGDDFDEKVDRFSALVIHTSLIALAEAPELWKRYYDEDNLIFRRADFQNPDHAAVFLELAQMGGVVAERAALLREACKRKYDAAPRLRDIREGKSKAPNGRGAQIIPLPVASPSNASPSRTAAATTAPANTGRAGTGRAGTPRSGTPRSGTPRAGTSRAGTPPASGGRAAAALAAAAPAPAPRAASTPKLSVMPAKQAAAKPAKQQSPKHAPPKLAPVKAAPAAAAKPTGTQPAWMNSAPAPAPAASRAPAPAPAASRAPAPAPVASRPAASASTAPAVAPPAPRMAPASAPAPRPAPRQAPAPAAASGWSVEWTRPGEMNEQHIWQVPIEGVREVPRTILGITIGTRREKYAERHEEKVEDRGYMIGGHRSTITSLAFTSDARHLVSGSRDGTVRVWSVQSGREAYASLEARSAVVAMALVPDQPMLAAALEDRRLLLWDYGLHRRVIHLEAPDRSPLRAVAVSSDGRWVAAGGARRRIYVWQIERGVAAGEIQGAAGRVESLAFTADGGGIVCGTHNGRLELFDRGSGASRWSLRTGLGRIAVLTVPRGASGVVGGAGEGTVVRWDLKDASELNRVRPTPERLASLAVSTDASLLLVGTASGRAYLTEAGSNRELALLDGHPGAVTAAALPGTGKSAATGATDGTVRFWSVQ